MENCTNCQESVWVTDVSRGDVICSSCGMVSAEKMIDTSPELATYVGEKNHERTVTSNPFLDSLKTTNIVVKRVGGVKKRESTRLVAAQNSLVAQPGNLKDQHLILFMEKLREFSNVFDFPRSVTEEATKILHDYEMLNKGKKRRLPLEAGALCALYLANNKLRIGKTMEEMILFATNVYDDDFYRARRLILEALPGQEVYILVEDIIHSHCQTLSLDTRLYQVSTTAYTKCKALVEGKPASTIAGSMILLACELCHVHVNKEDVSAVATASTNALNNLCKIIKQVYDPILTPNELRNI